MRKFICPDCFQEFEIKEGENAEICNSCFFKKNGYKTKEIIKDCPPDIYIQPTTEEIGNIEVNDILNFYRMLRHKKQTELRVISHPEKNNESGR